MGINSGFKGLMKVEVFLIMLHSVLFIVESVESPQFLSYIFL